MRSSRQRREGGFTLIEVMIALAILTVGAVGILSLQQASTRGNVEARRMTTATQLAKSWVERLRRDALHWTAAGDPVAAAPAARYLAPVDAAWRAPAGAAPENAGASWFGRDILPGETAAYCTHVMLTWVENQQSIRADVRTYWSRQRGAQHDLVANGCALGTEAAVTIDLASNAPDLSAVYTSTLLRWTPVAP